MKTITKNEAEAKCRALGTFECAAICLSHLRQHNDPRPCPEALRVWSHAINRKLTAADRKNLAMTKLEEIARAICFSIENGCDDECAIARKCMGGPAPVYIDAARAVIARLRALGDDCADLIP